MTRRPATYNVTTDSRARPNRNCGLAADGSPAEQRTFRRKIVGNQLAAYAANDAKRDLATKLASCVASSTAPDAAFGLASNFAPNAASDATFATQ